MIPTGPSVKNPDTSVAWLTITDNCAIIDGVAEVPVSSVSPGYRFQLVFTSGKRLAGTVVRHTACSTAVLLDGLEKERLFTTATGQEVRLKQQGGVQHWAPTTAVLRIDGQRDISRWTETKGEATMDTATERTASLLGGTKRGVARGRNKGRAPAAKTAKRTNAAIKGKELHPCKCGCGEKVAGNFRQGHDARYFGLLKRVVREVLPFNQLPKAMQTEAGNVAGAKALLRKSGH